MNEQQANINFIHEIFVSTFDKKDTSASPISYAPLREVSRINKLIEAENTNHLISVITRTH